MGTSAESVRLSCEAIQDWARRQGGELPVVDLSGGTFPFRQDETAEALYVICEGLVACDHVFPGGESLTLRVAGPGELVGRSAIVGGRYRASARVLSHASLLVIERANLTAWMEQLEFPFRALFEALAQEIRAGYQEQSRLLAATRGNVQEQLAVELWLLAERFGESVEDGLRIEPKLSCESLAQLTGRSRQSVNEALMALRRRGIVHSHYGWHTVRDPDRLYEKAEPFLAVTGE